MLIWLSLIILHQFTFARSYYREQTFRTGWHATVTASKSHFSKQHLGNNLLPTGQWRFGMTWIACTQTLFYFFFILCENIGKQSERARTSVEREKKKERTSIFFFSHPYPPALVVNKSSAVYIISSALNGLWRENRGSVNRLWLGWLKFTTIFKLLLLRRQWKTTYCVWSSIHRISLILLDLKPFKFSILIFSYPSVNSNIIAFSEDYLLKIVIIIIIDLVRCNLTNHHELSSHAVDELRGQEVHKLSGQVVHKLSR